MTSASARLRDRNSSGLPIQGEPEFLAVGKLRRPHGVRGEILLEILTDFPERLIPDVVVYIGNAYQPLRIQSTRQHKQALLVTFENYHDRESVGELRNQMVYVRADDRPPLPDGEYYQHELIGLRVLTGSGESLGVLTKILETGANDVYIVCPEEGPDILLPAIDPVILNVDIKMGEMRVHLLPGLIPDK